MEPINPADVKKLKPAREHIGRLQNRVFELENLLDDLARSVEIAQISRQFQLTEVFVNQAMDALKDRIVMPEINTGDMKIKIYEGEISADTAKGIRDKLNNA